MPDFIRKYMSSAAWLSAPEGEGAPAGDAGGSAEGTQGSAGEGASSGSGDSTGGTQGTDGAEGSPPGEAPATGASPGAGSSPARETDGTQRRIDKLTAEKWAERREKERLAAENRMLQEQLQGLRAPTGAQPQLGPDGQPVAPAAAPTPGARPITAEQLHAEASRIAAENAFNESVLTEITKGRTDHTDFDQVASNLQKFGELPRHFVEAAMATGQGAEIIYTLGGNLAEADRILALPPMQQAVAIARMASEIKPQAKKVVSDAPAPITPKVGGKGSSTPSLEDENLPIKDWMALREKAVAANAKRR